MPGNLRRVSGGNQPQLRVHGLEFPDQRTHRQRVVTDQTEPVAKFGLQNSQGKTQLQPNQAADNIGAILL